MKSANYIICIYESNMSYKSILSGIACSVGNIVLFEFPHGLLHLYVDY
jgi:hypothetical protein